MLGAFGIQMMGMALQFLEEHDWEIWKNLCEKNLGMRAREDQQKGKARKKKKEMVISDCKAICIGFGFCQIKQA